MRSAVYRTVRDEARYDPEMQITTTSDGQPRHPNPASRLQSRVE
ncbi:hypothetical protein [Kribbella sp. HUAS MG21]|uniref:Uncharacterized protein n=1 Tax=Kribbella sp. HUAS MG21 TaxID=3160966 RepID=A0AAU7THC3_9ACTN